MRKDKTTTINLNLIYNNLLFFEVYQNKLNFQQQKQHT